MTIKEQIDADLKQAMLSGDKVLSTTLRGLKSAILYAEVASGARESGISEQETVAILSKESKKRSESSEMFEKGGNSEKAAAERQEKTVIEKYLPTQLSDTELANVICGVSEELGGITADKLGKAIGLVKAKVGSSADGGRIAATVKKSIKQ